MKKDWKLQIKTAVTHPARRQGGKYTHTAMYILIKLLNYKEKVKI